MQPRSWAGLPSVANLDVDGKNVGSTDANQRHGRDDGPARKRPAKAGIGRVEDFVLPELRQPESEHDEPRQPRVFKVIDVMTREVLAEDADARSTVAVLEDVPSIVDVTVYVGTPRPSDGGC